MFSDTALRLEEREGAGEKWYVTKRVEAAIMKKDWRCWCTAGYAAMKLGRWKIEKPQGEEFMGGRVKGRGGGGEGEGGGGEGGEEGVISTMEWLQTALGDFQTAIELVRKGGKAWQECMLAIAEAETRIRILLWHFEKGGVGMELLRIDGDKEAKGIRGTLSVAPQVYREIWDSQIHTRTPHTGAQHDHLPPPRPRNLMELQQSASRNIRTLEIISVGPHTSTTVTTSNTTSSPFGVCWDTSGVELGWEWATGTGKETKGWIEIRRRTR